MKGRVKNLPRIQKTQQLAYELKIKEAMNKKVLTLNPEHTMLDVKKILKNRRISGIPVIQSKKLVGIVSIEDLIRCLSAGLMNEKVENIMTAKVITLFSDEPLVHAINKFDRYGFGRFPILDRDTGRLVGIITKKDIIQCLLRALEIHYHTQESRRGHRYRADTLFKEVRSDWTTLTMIYHVKGGDFKKAGEQSDRLKENLLKLGYSDEKIRRLIIAVLEAEMNLVIFTSGGNIVAQIELGKVTIRVVDHGPGIPDTELAMQSGYSTAPDFIRELGFGAGMGLPNIKNCTDEMKLESDVGKGTTLEFCIYY
jgi:CBS domain-containing protein/anti-sigma regulatory factor (Ser/Thr protein kinase)